ncbi:DUF3347 domain-containing protein [Niabella sp. W65]|nr:DUF3347 domain-containing protein [Niabella sp. W65]MCH7362480.1 DUF3347 domain-containing protein [Niabella sp. W65]ULT38435.1 DUF3347 domain-containing protein [Niabella sp. I65]
MNSYYALSAAFVNWDSAAVNKAATDVLAAIGNFKADELKKDSSIYETALFPLDNSKNSLTAIQQGSTWEEKKEIVPGSFGKPAHAAYHNKIRPGSSVLAGMPHGLW